MKMKKYNAPSIAEAMKLIRADLGEDAVIISSKVVETKKFFGLVKNKSFDVIAGIDRIEKKSAPVVLPDMQNFNQQSYINEPPAFNKTSVNNKSATDHEPQMTVADDDLKKELADLKEIMKSVQRQSIQSQYPDELLPFLEFLERQELAKVLITEIGDELFERSKQSVNPLTEEEMKSVATTILREKLDGLPIGGLTYEKKVINILGPTGVGKTTTIAKMAARSALEKKKRIGFITTDTYRIAAIEQLKTYAGLLQAPVEVAYNEKDFNEALQKLDYVDLIFIDTAGRNYKESKYVDDLVKLIHFGEDSESFLVLSLTAKQRDLEAIIDQFDYLPIDKFIFTKMDETNSIGTMLNLMIKYKKGLAYYTDGQEVPEDIEQPNLDKLLNLFFKENVNERSS